MTKKSTDMKLLEISNYLGITAAHLADLMGVTRQALNGYTSGRKGKPSKFVRELLAVANLNREEIIFPDVFDHPDGENRERPAYWLNVAIEAMNQASQHSADFPGLEDLESLTDKIKEIGISTLQEIEPK